MSLQKISQLSAESGVSAQTIRYYEKIGLLAPAQRSAKGYRLFDAQASAQLSFIKTCRFLGLALEEIKQLNDLQHNPAADCRMADELVARHLQTVQRKIEALHQIRDFLETVSDCREQAVADCKVIRTLQRG